MVVIEWISEWFKGVLVSGVMWNMDTLFTDVSNQIGEVAAQTGISAMVWNTGIYTLIRQLSETVILPIAGVVLTAIVCWELIQMIIEKNNLHDLDTWMFFKWVFKTFVAVMILSNTFNIVMAVFDVSQSVVASSAGLIGSVTDVTPGMMADVEAKLLAMEIGPLIGLWFQSLFIKITVPILNILIFVIAYGRMLEIYLLTSLAPIPFATLASREAGQIGQNYFKSLLAIAFQGFLIMVCIGIYAVLVQNIAATDNAFDAIWAVLGYTVLLCFALFKTGSLSKSIFAAH
jgi:hypothetical protein